MQYSIIPMEYTYIYSQQNADCNGAVRYIFAETAILVVTDFKNHSKLRRKTMHAFYIKSSPSF